MCGAPSQFHVTRDMDEEEKGNHGVKGEGIEKGKLCHHTRNLGFLPRRLIAMGHAYEELIIKIKYCRERVARLPSFIRPRECRVRRSGVRRDTGSGGGGSRALVFSPTGGNIHN